MYTVKNFRTKKALKEAVAEGDEVDTYQPGGLFPAKMDGRVYLEGPHYPEPHRWYASATVKDGIVVQGSVR
jgi:hypothetical protein